MNIRSRLRRSLLIKGTAAAVAAILAWLAGLRTLETLVLLLVATTFADVMGIWWDGRTEAKRTRGAPAGVVKLVGAEGILTAPCTPTGKVRIGLELWDARCGSNSASVGQRVVVTDFDGATLLVEPAA
jgi:membrane protein implicated in regulation of membrane protease activity